MNDENRALYALLLSGALGLLIGAISARSLPLAVAAIMGAGALLLSWPEGRT